VSKKRTPAAERQQETADRNTEDLFPDGRWITGRIPGLVPGPERGAHVDRWALETTQKHPPQPRDKLDTSVNGPAGLHPTFDGDAWEQVDWRSYEERVRRLRCRIFQAVQDGDLATARNLQRLMVRSWSNTLVSVRQVTQRNAGRKTAGIDGQVALTSQARAEVAVQVHATRNSWQPAPVRRVLIPKAGDKTKMRPLGIPVIMDRCHQARVRNALEPQWEARFESRSYGFRPGRGCHDAIESLFKRCAGNPSGCGFLTPTWLARSTTSTTSTYSKRSVISPRGG